MKPYARSNAEFVQKVFNYRLSRARRVSENAFGIMAAKFGIFHTAIQAGLPLVEKIILTCVVLHNFLRKLNDSQNLLAERCLITI